MRKMMKRLPVIMNLCLLAVAGPGTMAAYSQDTLAPHKTWTLAACLDYARQHNISINNLKLSAEAADQNLILSKNARVPNLQASTGQGITHGNSEFSTTSSYGLSSSVNLYNGGSLSNDIRSKQLSLEAANLNVEASENDITLQVTQEYLNVLLSAENIKYIRNLVSTSEAQVQQAEQKNQTGTIARKDLLQMEASMANDKYSLVSAENTMRQNLLTLKQLLQLPTGESFDIAIPDSMEQEVPVTSLEDVQRTALQTMPEIRSSELALQISDVEIQKVKSGFRPAVSMSGSLNSSYSKATNTYNANHSQEYFTQLGNNFYQQLGLTLSVPILDRKTTRVNLARANIEKKQSELDLENQKITLSQTVERAYLNLLDAKSQLAAALEQLDFARETYRIANEQLRIGASNSTEYLQQKTQYVQSMQSYIQAKYSSILYNKIFNFYRGIPVTQ